MAAIGIRNPGSLPNVLARIEVARTALQAIKGPNADEIKAVFDSLFYALQSQHELNKRLFDGHGGLPAKHGETHLGDDWIPQETPVGLGNANATGEAFAISNAAHVHKRDVRVRADGADVGTRNALNLGAGLKGADDPANDRVTLEVTDYVKHFLFMGA